MKYLLLLIILFPYVIAIDSSIYSDVLLVTNNASSMSINISNEFIKVRNITHQVNISVSTADSISLTTFTNNIRIPIETYLTTNGLNDTINYIVLTKDIPLLITTGCVSARSVDGALTVVGTSSKGYICNGSSGGPEMYVNPPNLTLPGANVTYWGMRVVSRLDGYTYDDVVKLFNTSSPIVQRNGICLIDKSMTTTSGYKVWDDSLEYGHEYLDSINVTHIFDNTTTFRKNIDNLTCYYSWGSNDGHVSANSSTWNLSFNYGSIGDTATSTSGRSFKIGTVYGQSLIADLIHNGLTTVKGYAAEPYLSSVTTPDSTLPRYYNTNYTNIEILYFDTFRLQWRDIFIGDPKVRVVNYINTSAPIPNITENNITNQTCSTEYLNYDVICDSSGCSFKNTRCELFVVRTGNKRLCNKLGCS